MSNSSVEWLKSALQGASNAAASNVSGPVDLLAWALRKGGVPVPSNAFGGSEWMRQQGLTADPRNRLAGLLGEGVGLAAPFAIAAKAPQIAGGLLKADDALTAGANRMADHFERTGAAYKYDPKQRGAFMGAKSKTWDAAANAKAAQMEAAGADPRAIWKETGNWKGPDGKWRQEIDDSASRVLENKSAAEYMAVIGPAEYPVGPISNVLEHQGLSAAYPDAMAIKTRLQKGFGGSYRPNTGFGEGFDLPSQGTHSTALHELQHALQRREGFATGGSPGSQLEIADPAAMKKVQKELEKLSRKEFKQGFRAPEDQAKFLQLKDKQIALQLDPYEAYRRLAGEAEARAVQSRMGMDSAQRRATFPADSYDVPLDKLIVRGFDGGNSANALAAALKGPR